jgi:hypothetical protein
MGLLHTNPNEEAIMAKIYFDMGKKESAVVSLLQRIGIEIPHVDFVYEGGASETQIKREIIRWDKQAQMNFLIVECDPRALPLEHHGYIVQKDKDIIWLEKKQSPVPNVVWAMVTIIVILTFVTLLFSVRPSLLF